MVSEFDGGLLNPKSSKTGDIYFRMIFYICVYLGHGTFAQVSEAALSLRGLKVLRFFVSLAI